MRDCLRSKRFLISIFGIRAYLLLQGLNCEHGQITIFSMFLKTTYSTLKDFVKVKVCIELIKCNYFYLYMSKIRHHHFCLFLFNDLALLFKRFSNFFNPILQNLYPGRPQFFFVKLQCVIFKSQMMKIPLCLELQSMYSAF